MDPRTGDVFWRMPVPGAHELIVTHDGKYQVVQRFLYPGRPHGVDHGRQ